MKLTGKQISDRFDERFKSLDKQWQDRVLGIMERLQLSYIKAPAFTDLPQPLNKPSNQKPYRRADVGGDLRIYWSVLDEVMIFHDICNHKEAKKYKDAHNW